MIDDEGLASLKAFLDRPLPRFYRHIQYNVDGTVAYEELIDLFDPSEEDEVDG